MAQTKLLPKHMDVDAFQKPPPEQHNSAAKSVLSALLYMLAGAVLAILLTDTRLQRALRVPEMLHRSTTSCAPDTSSADTRMTSDPREGDPFALPPARTEHMRYFPRERLLVVVNAKSGSTAVWTWLYTGVTGRAAFNCSTYVQDVGSPCWDGRAFQLGDLSPEQRVYALTARDVLRVAVWRDPFSRLVSCWKSKFACESRRYGTDAPDRAQMVPRLRRLAGLPETDGGGEAGSDTGKHGQCLNISAYADTLEAVRKRLLAGEVGLTELNPHLRPQELFSGHVRYDAVLDVAQLSEPARVAAVRQRLRFRARVPAAIPALHVSRGASVEMAERAAELIARFARLTRPEPAQES